MHNSRGRMKNASNKGVEHPICDIRQILYIPPVFTGLSRVVMTCILPHSQPLSFSSPFFHASSNDTPIYIPLTIFIYKSRAGCYSSSSFSFFLFCFNQKLAFVAWDRGRRGSSACPSSSRQAGAASWRRASCPPLLDAAEAEAAAAAAGCPLARRRVWSGARGTCRCGR